MTGRTNAAVGGGEVETVTGTIEVDGSIAYSDGADYCGTAGIIPPRTITVAKNSIAYLNLSFAGEIEFEGGIEPVIATNTQQVMEDIYFVTGDFRAYGKEIGGGVIIPP